MNHFVSIADHTTEELRHVLDVARQLKKQHKEAGRNDPVLAGKTLAMVFEKPSLRTRVSFAVAMAHLGGQGLILRDEEVGLDKREPAQDVARVLASMCDGIMARTFEHEKIERLAKYSKVPVINGLTDRDHPCQAMADFLTVEEHFGELEDLTVAFVGDGNNVARSLAEGCGRLGLRFVISSPGGYDLPGEQVDQIMQRVPELDFVVERDPIEAVRTADVIVTDTWVSMGQEAQKAQRQKDFHGFMVDERLMAQAPKHAVVLHCLPAYRGYEISEAVFEGPQSLVFQEAENRLHVQKGLIGVLMAGM